MHWLRTILILMAAVLVQATIIIPALSIRGARPELPLLVAVCVVLRRPLEGEWRWRSFWVGWIAGLLVDIYSTGTCVPFGSMALLYGLLAWAVSRAGGELFTGSAWAQMLILAPVCLAALGVQVVLLTAASAGSTSAAVAEAFWTVVYTVAVTPVVFAAVGWIERFIGVQSRRSYGRG